jgi:hypothetical protein
MSEPRILIRLLPIYFPRILEFDPASEFRGGLNPPNPPRYATGWEDSIRMNIQEVRCEGMDWIYVAGTCEYGNEHSGSIKCREFLD